MAKISGMLSYPNALDSARADGILAYTDTIHDDAEGKKQSTINSELRSEIAALKGAEAAITGGVVFKKQITGAVASGAALKTAVGEDTVKQGWLYLFSAAGTFLGVSVDKGDAAIALKDFKPADLTNSNVAEHFTFVEHNGQYATKSELSTLNNILNANGSDRVNAVFKIGKNTIFYAGGTIVDLKGLHIDSDGPGSLTLASDFDGPNAFVERYNRNEDRKFGVDVYYGGEDLSKVAEIKIPAVSFVPGDDGVRSGVFYMPSLNSDDDTVNVLKMEDIAFKSDLSSIEAFEPIPLESGYKALSYETIKFYNLYIGSYEMGDNSVFNTKLPQAAIDRGAVLYYLGSGSKYGTPVVFVNSNNMDGQLSDMEANGQHFYMMADTDGDGIFETLCCRSGDSVWNFSNHQKFPTGFVGELENGLDTILI